MIHRQVWSLHHPSLSTERTGASSRATAPDLCRPGRLCLLECRMMMPHLEAIRSQGLGGQYTRSGHAFQTSLSPAGRQLMGQVGLDKK